MFKQIVLTIALGTMSAAASALVPIVILEDAYAPYGMSAKKKPIIILEKDAKKKPIIILEKTAKPAK